MYLKLKLIFKFQLPRQLRERLNEPKRRFRGEKFTWLHTKVIISVFIYTVIIYDYEVAGVKMRHVNAMWLDFIGGNLLLPSDDPIQFIFSTVQLLAATIQYTVIAQLFLLATNTEKRNCISYMFLKSIPLEMHRNCDKDHLYVLGLVFSRLENVFSLSKIHTFMIFFLVLC